MSTLNLSPEPEQSKIQTDDYDLANRAKKGANWFYWIAGLSIINTLIFYFGGNLSFFAGLGVTQIADVIADQISPGGGFSAVKIMFFAFDFIVAGMFFICGLWAHKLHTWAFVAGMVFYLLDALLLLGLGLLSASGEIILPVAFHSFALFMIFRGLTAARQLSANRRAEI